jgi:hypothetical protein
MRSVAVSVVDKAQMGPVYRASILDYRDYMISVLIEFKFYTDARLFAVNVLIVPANTLLARKAGRGVKITTA